MFNCLFFVCLFWNLEKLSSQAAERDGLRRESVFSRIFPFLWNVFHTLKKLFDQIVDKSEDAIFKGWPHRWWFLFFFFFFKRLGGGKQKNKTIGMESAWAQCWKRGERAQLFVWLFFFLILVSFFNECPLLLPPLPLHCRPRRTCRPTSGTAYPSR